MGILVDVVILGIIALCVYNGYRRGLAKSLLKLVTSVLAIILAIVLFRPFQSFVIDNTVIDDNIQYSIERAIGNKDDSEKQAEVKEDSNMPEPIEKYVNENLKQKADETKEVAVTEVAKGATQIIVAIGCAIVIYIIAKILLEIISVIFDIFSKIPVIKQFNELGGIIYGVIEGVILVLLLMTLISVLTPLIGDNLIVQMIEQSFIGKFLYNSNIILKIIF